jgi:hypothetical protein
MRMSLRGGSAQSNSSHNFSQWASWTTAWPRPKQLPTQKLRANLARRAKEARIVAAAEAAAAVGEATRWRLRGGRKLLES